MQIPLGSRRRVLAGLAALPVFAVAPRLGAREINAAFREVEASLGGRIGVWAGRAGHEPDLGWRETERFAMCSSFKWLLAAAVLEQVERGSERLERPVPYGPKALPPHSPITHAHLAQGAMSVGELAEAAVTQSDNGAANLLLERLGGPPALTAFLRRHGDPVTRLDRNEPELNQALDGDPRDTTTPKAMVGDLARLAFGDALNARSKARLVQWMLACRTGDARIRASIPKGLLVGDKTGTGYNGVAGDIGFVLPGAGCSPLLMAIYVQAPKADPERRDAAIARCAAIVWENLGRCVRTTTSENRETVGPDRRNPPGHGAG